MKLVHAETARVINPGSMLHATSGPAWRYERIVPHPVDGHRVHVSRHHPKLGRVHKEFHPSIFGCCVVIDVKFYADTAKIKHCISVLGTQLILLTLGGFIAWWVAEWCHAHFGG
jgi:hypothetical protein